jgi:hypothetical protein
MALFKYTTEIQVTEFTFLNTKKDIDGKKNSESDSKNTTFELPPRMICQNLERYAVKNCLTNSHLIWTQSPVLIFRNH